MNFIIVQPVPSYPPVEVHRCNQLQVDAIDIQFLLIKVTEQVKKAKNEISLPICDNRPLDLFMMTEKEASD